MVPYILRYMVHVMLRYILHYILHYTVHYTVHLIELGAEIRRGVQRRRARHLLHGRAHVVHDPLLGAHLECSMECNM